MSILKEPIITEKMTSQGDKFSRFGFVVDKKSNKIEIKQAVEKMYGVTVTEVRTMVYYGKTKNRNTKSGVVTGTANTTKKAIVTLAKGEIIDFYSNI
jgi:large subunit ribosomal protein L23